MARIRTRNLAAAVAVAAAVTVLGGAPSNATVVDRDHYFSEPYSFSHDDCGFDVEVNGTSSGVFRIRAGKGKTATAFFGHDNYSFVETQTNPETGAFVTITANAVFNEIKARHVEGTIFEFEAVEAGQFRMYDSDGRLVARDRGSLTTTPCSTRRAATYRAASSSRTSAPTCTVHTRDSTTSAGSSRR